MTASEKLYQLADRAKGAETRIDAAKSKSEADLRAEVEQARETSQRKAAELKASAGAAKAGHDAKRAEHRAERAERDADAAVDFAAAALEEAEYAVLDAALARREAGAPAASR